MRRLILILLLATPFLGKASHIVGGEFELIHLSGNSYRLNLILYFDLFNGNPGAKDNSVTARIFRMDDNAVMLNVFLPLISESAVMYSQPECSIGDLQTNKLTYSTIITLSPNTFNHPKGYYISWERCCRNYTITNVYSEVPTPGAIYAGQTFYLEIPPVVKNGEPFIDSSPRLFPPLSDYACVGKPYYVDFGGTDDDGDSLVYSLVTPLNTLTPDALPPVDGLPRPKPFGKNSYPSVTWKPAFGLNRVMGGAPDLAISNEGFLTVTPTQTGLFVFAVKCEEFRDGVKIGETRRDFQMLSVVCKTAVPPIIKGRMFGDPDFNYRETMNITFAPNTPDAQRCIEVQISDEDIHNDFDNFKEKIKIRAKAIGNKKNINEVILPTIKTATLTEQSTTATFSICFDECPLIPNTPYQIHIIASDDACALPLLDTLRMTVTVQTPPNTPAHFIEPDTEIIESLNEGDPKKNWPVKVVDDEGDELTVSYKTDGFSLAGVGMDFDFTQFFPGIVDDTLSWDPACDKYDFSVKRNFDITIYADDNDFCSYNPPDSVHFNLTMIPPPNADPVIDTDITLVYSERFADGGAYRIFEKIEFNVFGHDDDVGYPIFLQAFGIGYQMIDYEMDFLGATGSGDISSHFTWPLECSLFDLAEKDSFNIQFIVVDKSNKCKIYQADTVDVALKILPPINSPPEITMQNLHPETTDGLNTATSFWGNAIEILLTGTDPNETPVMDEIKMEMIEASGNVEPTGYSFAPVSGFKEIESKFVWTPDCSIFQNNIYLNAYEFKFRVYDDHCESATADTITVLLNVKDFTSTDDEFQPANAITPNGDNFNDFFALDGYDPRTNGTDPDEEIGLPLDNCLNRFEYINIYNRWGKLVFTSTNRYFRWHAPNAGAGVYYYFVRFTNKDYKGAVMVRY